MNARRSIIVPLEHEASRLDSFLARMECYPTRSKAVRALEEGLVLVNGKAPRKNHVLAEGDVVVYEVVPQVRRAPLEGENIPLDLRYEDEWLMVLSKQTGLCVHPSPGHEAHTLANALVYRYGRDNLAHVQGDDRPGIVHRLDMETSGLMLCAKTDEAGNALQDMIRLREVDRRYLALVHGNVAYDTGLIDEPLARGFYNRLRMVVADSDGAREAITTFNVLERFEAFGKNDGYTLLECKLYTGRTHQIRVHMEFIGHCCVGDPLYSQGSPAAQAGLQQRQFLHSYALGLQHPFTGESLLFLDALPPDLQRAYDGIEPFSIGKTERGLEVFSSLETVPRQSEDVQL